MAVKESDMEKVKAFFELAQTEGRLESIEVEELDVLYHYSEWPAVLRVAKPEGVELWACELIPTMIAATETVPEHAVYKEAKAIQVGTQDAYGRNKWLSGVK